MANRNFGPYRATALWNEAVVSFRDGIILKENRHRLHKHKNSFTGADGVTFLHALLRTNKMFNPDVTRGQARQLLNQFLNSGLICLPSCHRNKSTSRVELRDSSSHVYKLTETMVTFSSKLPSRPLMDRRVSIDANKNVIPNRKRQYGPKIVLKISILEKIKELLSSLDVTVGFEPDTVKDDWVLVNINKTENHEWKTELPDWIMNAVHNLLSCSTQKNSLNTYPQFQLDVFQVVSDYFETFEEPVITKNLHGFLFNTYICLNSVNKIRDPIYISSSQENLISSLTSPVKPSKSRTLRGLPPDTCIETTFTSGDPVVRIRPQSSFDIIHFKNVQVDEEKTTEGPPKMHSSSSTDTAESYNEENLGISKNLSKSLEFVELPVNLKMDDIKGIDNKGFSAVSPYRASDLSAPNGSGYSYFPNNCATLPGRYMSKSTEHLSSIHAYINQGLNSSLDESSADDDDDDDSVNQLDYKYAIDAIHKMVAATQNNRSQSSSEHTASSSRTQSPTPSDYLSNLTDEDTKGVAMKFDDWNSVTVEKAVSIFQLILMMLPPSNRAQLRYLIKIIQVVPENTKFDQLSLPNVLTKLTKCIFGPFSHDVKVILEQMVLFITLHYEEIFSSLRDDFLPIANDCQSQKDGRETYCQQVSKEVFMGQTVVESERALNELLDQILGSEMSERTRRKHLNNFKSCHPQIYNKRVGSLPKSNTSSHAKTKNLRL